MSDSAECVLGSSMLYETILHSFLWLNSNYSDNIEKERNNSAHLRSNPLSEKSIVMVLTEAKKDLCPLLDSEWSL